MFHQLYVVVAFFYAIASCIASSGAIRDDSLVLVLHDPKLNDFDDAASSSVLAPLSSFDVQTAAYGSNFTLFYENVARFDHIVLFPSTKKALGLSQHDLMKFIEVGGNLVVVGGTSTVVADSVRVFLNELGIYPSPKNFELIDHFNTVDGAVELSDKNLVDTKIISSLNAKYHGAAALVSQNDLLFPIIRGSATSFTANPKQGPVAEDTTWTFGEQGFLAVALQTLSNSRVSWIGSESLFGDELVNWTFQRFGVLKLQFVQHYKNDDPAKINPTLYRIKDQAIYTVGVSELVDGKWVPFEAKSDEDKLQLSFKMLDPYQRLNLQPLGPVSSEEDSSELDTFAYYANFTIPDHHGMFTFELDYKRVGRSFLEDKRVVTVRHLANDEYKRSWDITNAWVYVASAGLVVLAWLLFVVNYIYVGSVDEEKKKI